MRTAAARPIEACLLDLLQHFGIERAHIAAGGPLRLKIGIAWRPSTRRGSHP
jgi:hypothetical protein